MSSARAAVQTLQSNTDKPLGYFIWWGTWEALIAPTTLANLFRDEGLDDEHVPDAPTPTEAFRRAVNYGVSGQEGISYKLIASDSVEITYGLREDIVDKETSRAPARQFARITWLPGLNKLVSDNPDNKIVQRIISVLPMFRDNHTSDDVRRAIKSALAFCDAVPVAGRGGSSCFVPAYSHSEIESLTRIMDQITNRDGETAASLRALGSTGGQSFTAAPVPHGSEWQTIGEQAGRSEFSGQVEQAEADLVEFQTRLETHLSAVHKAETGGPEYAGKGPRVSSLSNRVSEYKLLRDKIESYSAALSFRADDMLDKLDNVKTTIQDLLGS